MLYPSPVTDDSEEHYVQVREKCRYNKTCHLRSLLWTATLLKRPLYEVNILCNSLDLVFI